MEQPDSYYDKKYREKSAYHVHYSKTKYFPMWQRIIEWLFEKEIIKCLDIGCGSGQLAEMVLDNGIQMDGFDFSTEAVSQAQEKLGDKSRIWIGDVLNPNCYFWIGGALTGGSRPVSNLIKPYPAYVSTEVLEHVTDDLGMIKNIPKDSLFIFSVPTFGHEAHVRKFKAKKHITNRYKHLIEFERVEQFGKRFLSMGRIK